jgi:hypothetical protein
MTALQAPRTRASLGAIRSGRLLFFELSGGCIHSMTSLGLICWSQLKLAYDGLEREFKYFRKLETACAQCVHQENKKNPLNADIREWEGAEDYRLLRRIASVDPQGLLGH